MLALSLALLLQGVAAADAPRDTVPTYDSPATQALVERVISATAEIPAELRDYRARVYTQMTLAVGATSESPDADFSPTLDEFATEVRWSRAGYLHQEIVGHRVRLLVPVPYTLGSLMEDPWVIPHLYGGSIPVLATGTANARGTAQAVHPFGPRGPLHYHYRADAPVRLRVQGELVTLVPVSVSPRAGASATETHRVVGVFYLDVDRAAIARARFGFTEAGRGLSVSRVGTFMELENGLWEGRFWLPYFQRREIQVGTPLLGGTIAGRIVSRFAEYDLNTGWTPTGRDRFVLTRSLAGDTVFTDADLPTAADYAVGDFGDLQAVGAGTTAGEGQLRFSPGYARGDHLIRYNRVEGLYLGAGARLQPAWPADRTWSLYGTAGWAFAEQTARGELTARWRSRAPGTASEETVWGANATAYRRLREMVSFQPTTRWDILYTAIALFGGSDVRDYYDASGGELFGTATRGDWRGELGGRFERHDSVSLSTTRFLFGEAEDFDTLAGIVPGSHAALEAAATFERGPGAFSIGNSMVASVRGDVGVGDFRYQRLQGLLSFRRELGLLTLATRVDAGHVFGDPAPQFLFRFGGWEGVVGDEPFEFGGSTAALGRSRLLLGLPPRSLRPLYQGGFFIVPPLRPSLVLVGEAGWSEIREDLAETLEIADSRPTGGVRGAAGVGVSVFDDTITLEYLWPLTEDEDPRWRFGLVTWF